jgi:hypothetical protein
VLASKADKYGEGRETSYEKATTEALETLTSLPTSPMHPQAPHLQILKCARISCHPVGSRNRLSVFHVSCFVVQKKEEKEVTLVWLVQEAKKKKKKKKKKIVLREDRPI